MQPWIIYDRNALVSIADQLAGAGFFTGKPIQVTIKHFKRDRTLDQNAKVHAMLRDLALFTGYSERQMKDICKQQFAPFVERQLGTKYNELRVHTPKGTSEMNVEEMSNFIDALHALGAELDGFEFSD
jgi:hypothetical protein